MKTLAGYQEIPEKWIEGDKRFGDEEEDKYLIEFGESDEEDVVAKQNIPKPLDDSSSEDLSAKDMETLLKEL